MASLYAKFVIALYTLLHFIKRPFRWRYSGRERFLKNYRTEGLIPLSVLDRDWLDSFSQCLNCGLCDLVCPALRTVERRKFPGPSYLATTLTRSTPDFPFVDLNFSLCQDCEQCQSVCPNRVPIKEALEFIEAKLQEGAGGVA